MKFLTAGVPPSEKPTIQTGTISSASFGFGGYQDAMFGLSIGFESNDGISNVVYGSFIGTWQRDLEPPVNDRALRRIAENAHDLATILRAAKCKSVDELYGAPVQLQIACGILVAWRIHTEAVK